MVDTPNSLSELGSGKQIPSINVRPINLPLTCGPHQVLECLSRPCSKYEFADLGDILHILAQCLAIVVGDSTIPGIVDWLSKVKLIGSNAIVFSKLVQRLKLGYLVLVD
jgi:hypothetical protein